MTAGRPSTCSGTRQSSEIFGKGKGLTIAGWSNPVGIGLVWTDRLKKNANAESRWPSNTASAYWTAALFGIYLLPKSNIGNTLALDGSSVGFLARFSNAPSLQLWQPSKNLKDDL